MTVLVLGGAGYIGSHAVDKLIATGYDVAVIDSLVTGHAAAIHEKARFYQGDIRDKTFMREVLGQEKEIEGIMHFAAYSLVGESVTSPLKYFDNNVGGAQVMLEMMAEFDIRHVVFSSTAATYGEADVTPITETTPTRPTNPYGESKLIMEKMMKWQSQASEMTYVALRYFNVAGAKADGEIGEAHTCETHLIPLILQVPLGQRSAISIFGDDYLTPDGTCIRDYVHIEDLIDAHILALTYLTSGQPSATFNLGSSRGYSVQEMIAAAREVTGHPIPTQVEPRRAGDPSVLIASSEKARQSLGWVPKHTAIKAIIASAWQWHQAHPTGYAELEHATIDQVK